MKIEPFVNSGGVSFGISKEALVAQLGKPLREERHQHSIWDLELHYPSSSYRFNASLALVEIAADAPTVEIGKVSIPFKTLNAYLKEHDKETFEKVGFIVSPRFGIAFDPEFECWVTTFPRESLEWWKAIET